MTERSGRGPQRMRPLTEFLHTEAGGGVLLLAATVAALFWANSPWSDSYVDLWHRKLQLGPDGWGIREDLQHWVNDALMAVFFFLIGLEIKREAAVGELSDVRAATLPALAALGGMVVPALLFLALAGGGDTGRGWGIPMATDIAFAVGVLAVLGRRVPGGLKVFLLTLAGTLGRAASSRLALAVFVGLVVGKTLGISLFALAGRRLDLGRLPRGVAGSHVVGAGVLAGIGFTVALFITSLAFADETLQAEPKIGILAGSLVAGALGAAVLAALGTPAEGDIELGDEVTAVATP